MSLAAERAKMPGKGYTQGNFFFTQICNKLRLFVELQGMISWSSRVIFDHFVPDAAVASHSISKPEKGYVMDLVRRLWSAQEGQDIAEYAVMLAVILVIVVGTVRLIGSNANNVFSSVASSIQ
jgi:Flp pilus assembly pilin Flp